MEKHPLLASSADPNKVSLTIKSIGVWLIPAIIAISAYYGVDVAKADLTQLLEAIITVVASAMTAYGIFRKIIFKYFK